MNLTAIAKITVPILKTLSGLDVSREVGNPKSPEKPIIYHRRFIGIVLMAAAATVAWTTGVQIPEKEMATLGDACTAAVGVLAGNHETWVALWGAILTVIGTVQRNRK